MPARRSRPRRRPARKGRKGLKWKGGRKSGFPSVAGIKTSQQNATIIETIEYNDLSANSVEYYGFNLSEFPRAAAVATNFEMYKAEKVVWTYEPLYNTYQDTVGGLSKPYVYIAMNRRQRLMNHPTLANVQAMGSRGVPLTSKRIVSYRPNWLSPGLTALPPGPNTNTYTQGTRAQYSWLMTSPGTTQVIPSDPAVPFSPGLAPNFALYNGHITYADQAVAEGTGHPRVARVTCTVHWRFKGAVFDVAASAAVDSSK